MQHPVSPNGKRFLPASLKLRYPSLSGVSTAAGPTYYASTLKTVAHFIEANAVHVLNCVIRRLASEDPLSACRRWPQWRSPNASMVRNLQTHVHPIAPACKPGLSESNLSAAITDSTASVKVPQLQWFVKPGAGGEARECSRKSSTQWRATGSDRLSVLLLAEEEAGRNGDAGNGHADCRMSR